ncbi:secretion/DNA translocation related CpaE-like protein [Actinophytocola oryzae]|uniref:Secretion/DNA translocation related CpaE-like protein n=1 Tax=Actinophytocola oryzae TaxID=502181 RepID=A0A4R7UV98_9PSEU|nr:secretion/DNA translocation related CpaE-like protein [Actinophytocola oryzae]
MVNANRPLAFVTDEALLDELLKLAAAAGCELERVPDVAAARQRWSKAPLIVLDPAGVKECAQEPLPARDAVVVVSPDPEPSDLWKQAMEVGAERVVTLPGAEPWLVNALADAAEGPPSNTGKVLAVLGARGGAGASVFAVAVGLTALRAGDDTLLIDCDPRGGGLDVVLGAETEKGLRWPDMQLSAGRVAAASLHAALPGRRRGNTQLTLLSGARKGEGPAPDAVAAVIEAGRRAGEVVVCDLPRQLDAAAWTAIDRADLTVILTPAELRAAITAKQLAKDLTDKGTSPQLVVRGPSPGGLRADEIAATVGVPLLATMRREPQVAQSLERGDFHPKANGPLAQAARTTLAALAAVPPKPRRGRGDLRVAS